MEKLTTRKSPKRLIVDIPENYHMRIKMRAALRNEPIKTYVLRAVMMMIINEENIDGDTTIST